MSLKKKIGTVFFVLAIAAVSELLTTVTLGRELSAETFGKFKFINTIVAMFASLLVLGQNTAIIRVISQSDFQKYDWRAFVKRCLTWSGAAGFCVTVAAGYFYGLRREMFFIFPALLSASAVEYFSSLLRAREKYRASVWLSKLASMGFFPALAVLLLMLKNRDLWTILSVYALVFLCAMFGGALSVRKIESGAEPFPRHAVREGLLLFFISSSFAVMAQVDQFFIAKMLNYEKLADYAVMITVARGFELVSTALWFVLMPHYVKDVSRSIKRDTLNVALAAAAVVLAYAVFGKLLLHIFFGGKYDHALYLLKFFVAIGFCRVLYAIPAGVIGGRMPEKYLKVFLVTCVIGIGINFAGNFFLIPVWGLSGAAFATLVAWVFRVFLGYAVIFQAARKG